MIWKFITNPIRKYLCNKDETDGDFEYFLLTDENKYLNTNK